MIEKDKSVLLSLPFVRFAPFFATGMLTVYFGGGVSVAIFFAAASAALIYFALKKKKAALCAAGALCGIALMFAHMRLYCDPILKYAGETVESRIFVREITERSGQSEEIIAKAELGGRTAKLRLTCAEALPEDHFAEVTIELDAAEPTASDLSKGILLSGKITEIRSSEYAGTDIYSFFRIVRGSFYGRLSENVFGSAEELSAAMLFGEKSKLSSSCSEHLKVSGAAHYTAVSGAHFAVLAAALLSIIPQSRRRTRLIISLMFAPAGLMFYGISPSVLRASVMFFIYGLGLLFHRKSNPLNSLCIAVTVIPVFSPFTIVDAGFAMSVLGVFGVGVVGPAAAEKLCEFIPDKAKPVLSPSVTALSCSVCAVICTTPISAALFKSVSLLGAVTSLLLAPLIAVGMTFMLLLGMTRIPLFAIPIDWAMSAAGFIVKSLGRCRALTLSLDYEGAWILSAILALAVTVCAFGDIRTFSRFGRAAGVLAAAIIAISVIRVQNRREIRFVGNTYSSAAIVFDGSSAAVFVSGGGDGISTGISRVLREHGAVKITEFYAPDASYGGALAVNELSEMLEIDKVYSNELAKSLLPGMNVVSSEYGAFSAGGMTIASVVSGFDADILLYGSEIGKVTESSAKYAVYFSNKEYELPENFHNARINGDFRIKL